MSDKSSECLGVDRVEEVILFHLSSFLTLGNQLLKYCVHAKCQVKKRKNDASVYNLQGYVKRQALYACGTCSPTDAEPAGVCLACTLTCHEGHVLYELYTKR